MELERSNLDAMIIVFCASNV